MTDKPYPIELWDVAKLVPYERNAKIHTPEQVKKLARAIKHYGWTQPIIVWTNGEIIAGHGRRLAALELGLARVPVIVRSDLSKAEADALRLADNRITSTDYDQAEIRIELERLADEVDLSLAGFDDKEIDFAIADLGEIDTTFFADDIGEAVEKQKEENKTVAKTTDETAAPVADAFGFKRVTIAQSRQLRGLVTRIEERTGKTGAEALLDFLSSALS